MESIIYIWCLVTVKLPKRGKSAVGINPHLSSPVLRCCSKTPNPSRRTLWDSIILFLTAITERRSKSSASSLELRSYNSPCKKDLGIAQIFFTSSANFINQLVILGYYNKYVLSWWVNFWSWSGYGKED